MFIVGVDVAGTFTDITAAGRKRRPLPRRQAAVAATARGGAALAGLHALDIASRVARHIVRHMVTRFPTAFSVLDMLCYDLPMFRIRPSAIRTENCPS